MATSFIWSIICIYFLSLFAEYVAWAIVFVVQIGFIGAAVGFGGLWANATAADASDAELAKANGYIAGAIAFGISAAVFALMIFCGWN